MGSLDGAVAVVTGASRGIGKGCAVELGRAGATVYVTGRTLVEGASDLPGSLQSTADEISRAGGTGVPIRCDHASDDDVGALFERVATERGRLDILVNSAFAVPERMDAQTPFWETPIGDWDVMMDVGTRSAYTAAHHAARSMVPARRGLIVNISSAGAIRYFHHIVYGIGKAALDRFTRDGAYALRPHQVAIVSLWPYLVSTERVEQMLGVKSEMTESPRFVGRAVVALASDDDALRWSGRAVTSRRVAEEYGYRDLDGRLPPEQPWQPPDQESGAA